MTQVRPVFAGDTVHIQRRTVDGRFFLVPKPETLALVRYAYGLAADRFGLVLHALCVMSTHTHVIATDKDGRHPEFTAFAHRLIALGLKRIYGIDETVWRAGGASVQRLVEAPATIEALAYVRVNPVAAGCVEDERAYPGVFGADEDAPLNETSEIIRRPSCFGPKSKLPAATSFILRAPKSLLDELGVEGAASAIASAVARHRTRAHETLREEGRGFLGMRKVLSASVWSRAEQPKRAPFNPTFKGVVASAIRRASETLRAFRYAYAEALGAYRAGSRDVLFPPGTYLMKRRYNCSVALESV